MRRTQQTSIAALEKAIEEQKNARDFNFVNDLKMLRKQYTNTSKRDYLRLLDLLIEKYGTEETAAVHAALLRKCQALGVEPFGFASHAASRFASLAEWGAYGWPARFQSAEFDVDVQITVTDT